jgi:methionyl-tRNA formyltransferase
MSVHLYASDPSVFSLIHAISRSEDVTAIVFPGNRAETDKVAALKTNAAGIPVFEHRRGESLPDNLPEAERAVCWLYSQIFPTDILNRYPGGMLNMHGGSIPDYRGASVLQWAIVNGEAELGVTWHSLVEAVDAGPIWAESQIPILQTANAFEMREAMIAKAIHLFPNAWSGFRWNEHPLRLPVIDGGKIWPQRRPRDGLIEVGWPEQRVRNLIRALCPPWPPAFMISDGSPIAVDDVCATPMPGAVPYLTQEGRTIHLILSERSTPS